MNPVIEYGVRAGLIQFPAAKVRRDPREVRRETMRRFRDRHGTSSGARWGVRRQDWPDGPEGLREFLRAIRRVQAAAGCVRRANEAG